MTTGDKPGGPPANDAKPATPAGTPPAVTPVAAPIDAVPAPAAPKVDVVKPAAVARPAAAKPIAAKPAVPMYGDGARATKGDKVEQPPEEDIVAPPPWWKRLRTDPPFFVRLGLGAAMVALVFLLWWFVTRGISYERIVSPATLGSPKEVWDSIAVMQKPVLLESIIDTLQRVFLGVGLAAIVGVTLGVVAGSIRSVSAALGPIVIFLRSVPMAALLFLTLLLFGGIGEKQKTMFIFLAVIPFVFSDTIKAVSIVPERYVETAQTLGASRFQIIWKVLIPLSIPDVITSLRFQFGLALGYITLAESAGQTRGLGNMIEAANRQGPREHVILLLFIIAFIAYGIDLILRTLQRGAFRWRKDL
ncbi:MAG: ABC transporter permease subunit [Deltaproteobacteria bacterium]|nr:ABC transporter permease subunit [Deltaproteobacteria bacterium]